MERNEVTADVPWKSHRKTHLSHHPCVFWSPGDGQASSTTCPLILWAMAQSNREKLVKPWAGFCCHSNRKLMDTDPWKYYCSQGKSFPQTRLMALCLLINHVTWEPIPPGSQKKSTLKPTGWPWICSWEVLTSLGTSSLIHLYLKSGVLCGMLRVASEVRDAPFSHFTPPNTVVHKYMNTIICSYRL